MVAGATAGEAKSGEGWPHSCGGHGSKPLQQGNDQPRPKAAVSEAVRPVRQSDEAKAVGGWPGEGQRRARGRLDEAGSAWELQALEEEDEVEKEKKRKKKKRKEKKGRKK